MRIPEWDRRQFLQAGGIGTLGLVIGACGQRPDAYRTTSASTPSTSDAPIPDDAIALTPDDSRLTFSSFATVDERSASRFHARRFEDGQGLGAVTPGGRLALQTDSPYIAFHVTFLSQDDDRKIRDDDGFWDPFYADILIDGRIAGAIASTSVPHDDAQTGSLSSLPKGEKLIELIWPYERAMVLTKVLVAPGATVGPALPPLRRIVCGGDSITQGFAADRPSETYAFRLARNLGLELINMGFASRIAVGSDGTRDGSLSAHIGTYMIGVNDFLLHADQQRTPAQFGDELKGYIENWFLADTSGTSTLHVISPLYVTRPEVSGLTLQTYRDTMKQVCTIQADRLPRHRLRYIDGLTLMPASAGLLFDGVHPTNSGHAEVARRLAAIMARP